MTPRKRNGFTLVELLIVMTIIGLLSSAGVASYDFVRVKARDTKRIADVRSIREAIELYYDRYDQYPTAPKGGIILGTDGAKAISVNGITPLADAKEPIFMLNVPANILPGGIPYYYQTTDQVGQTCLVGCQHFQVNFGLETAVGGYASGPHKLTDVGVQGLEGGYTDIQPPTFLQTYVPTAEDLKYAFGTAQQVADLTQKAAAAHPEVRTAASVAAPITIFAAVANIGAVLAGVLPIINVGQFFVFLLTQPFLFFGRRKRESWGTVYDAGTKVPIDLATVRLIDANGRVVAAKVTDKNGRYAFTARAGSYRLEVAKPNFEFPSVALAAKNDDGHYLDIYHGTLIRVDADGTPVTVNVPIDRKDAPPEEERVLLSLENRKQIRKTLAALGPVLGLAAFVAAPSALTGAIVALHLFVYFGFKSIAEPPTPKNLGIVFEEDTKDPVDRAVVRILSLPYHKVLETRLTDARGHYSFYVGHGKYYLTVTKPGYQKTETEEIDFSTIEKPTFIASDLPLRREEKP